MQKMIKTVKVQKGRGEIENGEEFLKIYTEEPMKNNRANHDVMTQIARYYAVDIRNVRILRGAKSRVKIIEITKN